MKKLTFVVIVGIAIINEIFAATGGNFLSLPVGARGAALNAYSSTPQKDVFNIFWNPAGICEINNFLLGVTHIEWFEKIKGEAFATVLPHTILNGKVALGMAYFYLSEGMEYRSGKGEKLFGEIHPYTPLTLNERLFYYYGLSCILSYAREIYKNLPVGINIKFVQEKIDIYTAAGASLDIGVSYEHKIRNAQMKHSIAMYNFSPGIKYLDNITPLPLIIKLATAAKLLNNNFLFSSELSLTPQTQNKLHIGSEYKLPIGNENAIFLRGGLQYTFTTLQWTKKMSYSLGVGVNIKKLNIDYAYRDEPLGSTQQVSISLGMPQIQLPKIKPFGKFLHKEKKKTAEEKEVSTIISSHTIPTKILLTQLTVSHYMNEYEVEVVPIDVMECALEKLIFRLRIPLLEEFAISIYSLNTLPQEIKIYPNEKIYSALAIEHKFTYGQLYSLEYFIKVKKDWCTKNQFASSNIKIFTIAGTDRIYGDIVSTAEDENYYYYTVTFDKFAYNLIIAGISEQN
mgnify:CR=1 FL=1